MGGSTFAKPLEVWCRRWILGVALVLGLVTLSVGSLLAEAPTTVPPSAPTMAPVQTKAIEAEKIKVSAPAKEEASNGLRWLGFLAGYFLAYSIRSGTRTQDVFKSFLGLLGVGGGVAGVASVFTLEEVKAFGLGAFLEQTIWGAGWYVLFALILISLYSYKYKPNETPLKLPSDWALFAETLGKVLLGEDFRPRA
jgi:hypothetical protein